MRVQRHVWHAVTFLLLLSAPRPSPHCCLPPLLVVRCLVSSFCFQTGVKETNHLHTAPTSSPPSFPTPPFTPLSQQINGHKAFLPARRWDGAKFTSRRRGGVARCSSCLHRPENYSAHKLLNAKSFDFNYVENFYCPRRGLRMRKRRTFAQLLRLPGCVCLSVFRIFPLSSVPLSVPLSLFVSLCVCGFFRDSARQAN